MPGAWGIAPTIQEPEPATVNDRASAHGSVIQDASPVLTPRGPETQGYSPNAVQPNAYQGYSPSLSPTTPLKLESAQSVLDSPRIGDRTPNWPVCKPIIYHDIHKDIKNRRGQRLCLQLYSFWYAACIIYLVNFAACLSAVFVAHPLGLQGMGIALAILILGVPGSFIFWYRMLYNALRMDSSTTFFLFFSCFLLHIGICIFLVVGLPGYGGSGVMLTIDLMNADTTAGITCAISTTLLIIEAIAGIALLNQAVTFWKIRGLREIGDAEKRESAW